MGLFTATLAAALAAPAADLPTAPPPRFATDPEVAKHLAAWKQAAGGRKNVWANLTINRTDSFSRKEVRSDGVFLAMKPNLFRFRLVPDGDKDGLDYEAWVYDGDSLFSYRGPSKTIVEVPLRPRPPAKNVGQRIGNLLYDMVAFSPGDLFPLRCLTGLDAGGYDVTLVRAGALGVVLDFEPRPAEGKSEFERARVWLAGPGTKTPYVPVEVRIAERGGDVAVWRFTSTQADVPGITPRQFRFEPVEGFKHLKPFETWKWDR